MRLEHGLFLSVFTPIASIICVMLFNENKKWNTSKIFTYLSLFFNNVPIFLYFYFFYTKNRLEYTDLDWTIKYFVLLNCICILIAFLLNQFGSMVFLRIILYILIILLLFFHTAIIIYGLISLL
jgi:hypothetical protein